MRMYFFKLLTLLGLVQVATSVNEGPKVPSDFTNEHLHGFSALFDGIVARLLNVAPANGTRSVFAEYALTDQSNDYCADTTTEELISEAGFDSEVHYVEADDGYLTQLIRLINPLADQRYLKQPPVALFHGGVADTSMFIIQSSTQHHPQSWPRLPDEKLTSWNRSLAFMLSNNGYDVWLVGTRGCNPQNQLHTKLTKRWHLNSTRVDVGREWADLNDTVKYWSNFTYDDIIEKEVPRQLDGIMHLTGSDKISIVGLSNSALLTMGLLSSRPDYAAKVHNYVIMAPLLSGKNSNNAVKVLYRTACLNPSEDASSILFSELILSDPVRRLIMTISKSPYLRYAVTKPLLDLFFGPTPRFQSLLELNLLGHLFRPFGFRTAKHLCQVFNANKVQHFDYGLVDNQKRYGSPSPPAYDFSKLNVSNWMLISTGNDPYSKLEDVTKLFEIAPKKPYNHIYIEDANHLDTIAMADVDLKINLPILEFMDTFPGVTANLTSLADRGRDYKSR